MNSNLVIYHNPRCSKSRETLALLIDRGEHPLVIEYLKDVPSHETLQNILKKLKMRPRDIVRTKDDIFKDLNVDLDDDDDLLLKTLVKHPALIERPIVVRGERAVIGRPPENIEALWD